VTFKCFMWVSSQNAEFFGIPVGLIALKRAGILVKRRMVLEKLVYLMCSVSDWASAAPN